MKISEQQIIGLLSSMIGNNKWIILPEEQYKQCRKVGKKEGFKTDLINRIYKQ